MPPEDNEGRPPTKKGGPEDDQTRNSIVQQPADKKFSAWEDRKFRRKYRFPARVTIEEARAFASVDRLFQKAS